MYLLDELLVPPTGSIEQSNLKHAPGWIAAAGLEEHAGRMVAIREIVKMGCEQRPKSKDVWLEAARLHVSFRPSCSPFSCLSFRCLRFEGRTHVFVSRSRVRTLAGLLFGSHYVRSI